MKLKSINIKNFRAISECNLTITDHTVLIGTNGVGKSCILKAIEKFFSKSASVNIEDFHDRNTTEPIEIGLIFNNLESDEIQRFSSRIHNGELRVTRIFLSNLGNKENGRYYGSSYRHPKFDIVRNLETANERKKYYNQLVDEGTFEGLERQTRVNEVLASMEKWESKNTELCKLGRDDGAFEGFVNVARGSLQKYVSFIFIPAIRDAAADAADNKSTVIGQLIELLVKTVVQKREDVQKFQKKMDEEYRSLVAPESLGELGELAENLSKTLQLFYGDSTVDLNWKDPEELRIPLPTAETILTEQGYAGPIDGKGHGLQRAFVFTILQHLANALHVEATNKNIVFDNTETIQSENEKNPSHSIIIAIEEPELYQHPTKQKHFSRVLRELGNSITHNHAASVQVLICSHSPHFLSTNKFEEVRVVHRVHNQKDGTSVSNIESVSYDKVIQELKSVSHDPNKAINIDSLKARLHTLDPIVAEGFFAQKVVLVEGVSDQAALIATSELMNRNFESESIALIGVGGKTNLDKPLIIFKLLGIKTYLIFDSDAHLKEKEQKWKTNIELQKLCGDTSPIKHRTFVGNTFSSFKNCLEETLKQEIGDDFDTEVGKAAYRYGLANKDVKKCPVPLTSTLEACAKKGHTATTINEIVKAIYKL